MNLDLKQPDKTSKEEIELVQKKKHEYKLLDSFSRRKGTKLFSFNPTNRKIKEIEINYSDTMHCFLTREGWRTIDFEQQKATVDSRLIYFEAMSIKTAISRVKRYENNIHLLCNLQPVKDGCIKFY